jgi:periplasmic protein TonB
VRLQLAAPGWREPLGFAQPGRDRRWLGASLLVAAGAHGAVALGLARFVRTSRAWPSESSAVMEVTIAARSSVPPAPASPTRALPEPRPAESRAPKAAATAATPPAPAQAARALTQRQIPGEPVDLTGDTLVAGSASAYAGGITASSGSDPNAAGRFAQSGSAPAQDAPPSARPPTADGVDRSRRAAILGGARWNCPFPPEADSDQIDHAVVTLHVDVDPSGAVRAMAVDDPGHGFGREARRCAMSTAWRPALDQEGVPTESKATIHVRFDR